jgi:uncharacterized protein DUF3617
MMRRFVLLVAFLPLSAFADIEPGNWEFTVNTTARGLGGLGPKPGPAVSTRCITAEQASNPGKVLSDAGARGECELSNQQDTGSEFSVDLSCKGRVPLRGSAKMRYTAQTMDGNIDLDGEVQGMQFATRSQISARRLGPCTP